MKWNLLILEQQDKIIVKQLKHNLLKEHLIICHLNLNKYIIIEYKK